MIQIPLLVVPQHELVEAIIDGDSVVVDIWI
jgi:hypothetical protein